MTAKRLRKRIVNQPIQVPTNSGQVAWLRRIAKLNIIGSTSGEVARFFITQGLTKWIGNILKEEITSNE